MAVLAYATRLGVYMHCVGPNKLRNFRYLSTFFRQAPKLGVTDSVSLTHQLKKSFKQLP